MQIDRRLCFHAYAISISAFTLGEEIAAKKVRNFLLGIENDDKKTLLGVYNKHVKGGQKLLLERSTRQNIKEIQGGSLFTGSFYQTRKIGAKGLRPLFSTSVVKDQFSP